MFKKMLVVLGSVAVLFSVFKAVGAEEMEMQPYLYVQDFEGEEDPVSFWGTNGKYTVNFKGLTEEKAFSGKKSFKLDVSFQEGSYFYWSIPVTVPAEGKLKFSARLLVGGETTGHAGFGVNVNTSFPAASGCWAFSTFGSTGEWGLIEEDVVNFVKKKVDKLTPKQLWGATGDNVCIYVDRIGFFLFGRPGKRVVVYVDDIKLKGEVPGEVSYKQEIQKRRAPYVQKFNEQIRLWEESIREAEDRVEPDSQQEKDLKVLKEEIATIKKRKSMPPKKYDEMNFMLRKLKNPDFDI